MKTSEKRTSCDIPLHIRNEAAAWIMQLHASDRSANADDALREWLAQSAAHREAFEAASDMWNAGATLPVSVIGRMARADRRPAPVWRRPVPIAATFVFAAILAGVAYRSGGSALTTGVGEQRTLSLEDGTRVTLNTATRLKVAFGDRARRVSLESGEALFDVARNPDRPFVVSVAGHEVTALGTSFVVRYEHARTEVTLMEGKVSVAPLSSGKADGGDAHSGATVLQPGERLTLAEYAQPKLDRPALDRVTAWKRGQAAFQNTPLPAAIEEMNRYSKRKLVIGDDAAAAVRVSGIFRVGESETFALALVNTYPLKTAEQGDVLLIYGGLEDRGK